MVAEPDTARGYAVLGARKDPDSDPERARLQHLHRALILAPAEAAYRALSATRMLEADRQGTARTLAMQAAVLDPGDGEGYLVLAEMLRSQDRAQDALVPAIRARVAAPANPVTHVTSAILYHRLSRVRDAREAIASAMVLRPRDAGLAARAATLLPHIVNSADEITEIRDRIRGLVDQDGFEPINDPIHEVGTVPFSLAYHGVNDRDLLVDLGRFYRRVCPSLSYTAPHIGSHRNGRRRVAFVSEFFRSHSVYNMTEGHLRHLDRRDVEVIVVQIGDLPDDIRRAIADHVDRVITVPPNLEAVRSKLSDLALDVLIFADIGMTPMSYFLAFARLAPLQIVLPGHPVTTGIDTVDVFFTSDWMEPANYADHYSETPHRVDGLAIAYAEARIAYDPVDPTSLGLTTEGALYLCGQMPFKIHPEFDRVIGDVLARDPTGTLALFDAPGDFRDMRTPLLERIRRANADRPTVLERLRILPRLPLPQYLGLMKAADVVLDTTHFSGGNTTMQSLALARPVVALPTEMMRGRVAMAPLHAMGLEADLIVDSVDAYVTKALSIAQDKDLARDLGARLAAAAPSLIDADTAALSLRDLILSEQPTG